MTIIDCKGVVAVLKPVSFGIATREKKLICTAAFAHRIALVALGDQFFSSLLLNPFVACGPCRFKTVCCSAVPAMVDKYSPFLFLFIISFFIDPWLLWRSILIVSFSLRSLQWLLDLFDFLLLLLFACCVYYVLCWEISSRSGSCGLRCGCWKVAASSIEFPFGRPSLSPWTLALQQNEQWSRVMEDGKLEQSWKGVDHRESSKVA